MHLIRRWELYWKDHEKRYEKQAKDSNVELKPHHWRKLKVIVEKKFCKENKVNRWKFRFTKMFHPVFRSLE